MTKNNLLDIIIKNKNNENIAEYLFIILEKNNLLSLLPGIIKKLNRLNNWQEKQSALIVRAPFQIDNTSIDLIEKIFSKKVSEQIIQKDLIVGLVANDDKNILDLSLNRLLLKLN